MNLKGAIKLYRKNLIESCYGKRPFKMHRCGTGCSCVRGISWNGMKLDGQDFIVKGHKFKISVDLANSLETEWLPLIQPHRLNQTWEDRVSE